MFFVFDAFVVLAAMPAGSQATPSSPVGRRALLGLFTGYVAAPTQPASALAAIARQPSESMYDAKRDSANDQSFAKGMATGMKQYEQAIEPVKTRLFSTLLTALPPADAVVVEIGMGTFPNAKYYTVLPAESGPARMDVIGVDPNDAMSEYAMNGPAIDRLRSRGHSVRNVHGVAEALPMADASVDAVVCTLTLCSVPDPSRALAEVRRILKPGGRFLFVEHVLSETDRGLAAQQVALTPLQMKAADGCHLDRRTLEQVKAAGFSQLDSEYFELTGFSWLNPTVVGIAVR